MPSASRIDSPLPASALHRRPDGGLRGPRAGGDATADARVEVFFAYNPGSALALHTLTQPLAAALASIDTVCPTADKDVDGTPGFRTAAGAGMWLCAGLGLLADSKADQHLARLLTDSAHHHEDAVVLIHVLRRPQDTPVLVLLLTKHCLDVRIAAAGEIARRAPPPMPPAAAQATLEHALAVPGVNVPLTPARILSAAPPNKITRPVLTQLRTHASALVRYGTAPEAAADFP